MRAFGGNTQIWRGIEKVGEMMWEREKGNDRDEGIRNGITRIHLIRKSWYEWKLRPMCDQLQLLLFFLNNDILWKAAVPSCEFVSRKEENGKNT